MVGWLVAYAIVSLSYRFARAKIGLGEAAPRTLRFLSRTRQSTQPSPIMPQPLNTKDQSLFRQVVRNFELKQYKKGKVEAHHLNCTAHAHIFHRDRHQNG